MINVVHHNNDIYLTIDISYESKFDSIVNNNNTMKMNHLSWKVER